MISESDARKRLDATLPLRMSASLTDLAHRADRDAVRASDELDRAAELRRSIGLSWAECLQLAAMPPHGG